MPALVLLLLTVACLPAGGDRETGSGDSGSDSSGSGDSGAPSREICNGIDDDGDGLIDDRDEDLDLTTASTWHPDADGDGYGDDQTEILACEQPYANSILEAGDCDDDLPWVNPAADEVCDGLDDDCDTLVDDDDPDLTGAETTPGYEDKDGDGFGDPSSLAYGCADGDRVEDATDCDDGDSGVYPHAEEQCGDGLDQDCDGLDTVCGEIYGDLTLSEAAATVLVDHVDGDAFGDGLDLLDWNGDGVTDLAVGASLASDGATEGGAVFVYFGPLGDGALDGREEADVAITSTEARKYLGSGVMRLPDLDGDGDDELFLSGSSDTNRGVVAGGSSERALDVHDALVAAIYCTSIVDLGEGAEDGSASWACGATSGGVRVIEAFDVATPLATLDTDDALDDFGESTRGRDMDGDGVLDLWVGAAGVTFGSGDEGAVWLVTGPLADEVLDADTATVRGESTNQQLGESVAVADLNGDGYPDGLAGSALDDSTADNAGAWFGWLGPVTTGLSPESADIAIYGDEEDQKLGDQAPPVTDQDGDAREDLLLISFRDDDGADTNNGAAWLLYGPLTGTTSLEAACDEGACVRGGTGDHLGGEAALGEDLTGDGVQDLVISASMASWGEGVAGGLVYVVAGGS